MKWTDLPYKGPEYNEDTDTLTRQSIIGSFQLCEYREKLKGEKGYLKEVSEPLVFGTCEHHLLSSHLQAGETRLDLLSTMNEWVEQILVEEYEWSLAQVPNPRDFFSELASAYTMWVQTVLPTLPKTMLGVEDRLDLFLGEGSKGNLFLGGTPDVVYENAIVDWKTSGRPWKPAKAHLSIQASLYMALAKQNYGTPIRKFRFWIYERSNRTWMCINTERKVVDINAALVTAYDSALKLESGLYTAQPVPETWNKTRGWYCSAKYCSAWNICPAKYLNDNVNEKEVAIRSW